jgi:hypothetical protein
METILQEIEDKKKLAKDNRLEEGQIDSGSDELEPFTNDDLGGGLTMNPFDRIDFTGT